MEDKTVHYKKDLKNLKLFIAKPIIDFNFAMNTMQRVILSLFLLLIFSCNKTKPIVNADDSIDLDLADLMSSDDYFKQKRHNSKGKSDSIVSRIVYLSDINADGISDTATIEYNQLNSKYKIKFSCYNDFIGLENISELQLKDMNDLNGDGFHEIMLFIQSEESCWDEIRLYSWVDKWVEKYNGLTYQCTENNNNNYQFRKIDNHTVQLTTYGVNRDSIDAVYGDTLENIIPNALNMHTITW